MKNTKRKKIKIKPLCQMLRSSVAKPLLFELGIAHGDLLPSLLTDNLMVAQMLLKKEVKKSLDKGLKV